MVSTGAHQRRHVWEVVVDGMALDACPLGDRTDRGLGGPNRPVELEGSPGDALTHRLQLLLPPPHPVKARAPEFLVISHVQRKY
jgi:hypothetical protein